MNMTIAEFEEKFKVVLEELYNNIKLEALTQMTPTELRKFLRKAKRAYKLLITLDDILAIIEDDRDFENLANSLD